MDTEARNSSPDSNSLSVHNPDLDHTSNFRHDSPRDSRRDSPRDSPRDSTDDSSRDSTDDSSRDSDHNPNHDPDYDSDDGWVGVCVPPRCRLCTYRIEPDEWTVATDNNGEVSSSFVNCFLTTHEEVKLKKEFRPCTPHCSHDARYLEGAVPGYHADCFNYAGTNLSHDLLSATAYPFEPVPSYDLERERATTQLLATKIGNIWRRLPHELSLMIAKLLVREYTIATMQGLYTTHHQPDGVLDFSQAIWARYADIGGFGYIHELSTTGGPCFRKLYDPEITPKLGALYVLEDHLGVRDLLLRDPEGNRTESSPSCYQPGSWWRTITNPQKLKVEHDGVKVRKIEDELNNTSNLRNVTFSRPMPPGEITALEQHCRHLTALRPGTPLESLQMVPFHINGPGVYGYSFCWSYGLVYFHAHCEGEDKLAMYNDFDILTEDPFWIHLPVTPGEYINSIWFRRAEFNSSNALWIVTNKGTGKIIGTTGAHPITPGTSFLANNSDAKVEWSRLIGPLNEGQSVLTYFNLSAGGIQVFATPHPSSAAVPGPEPPSSLRSNYCEDTCLWFGVGASLANAVEIITFRKKASCLPTKIRFMNPYTDDWGTHSPIIGIALVYADRTTTFLGQWRLDCETSQINIEHAKAFYMAFRLVGPKTQQPYVSEIRLYAPSTSSEVATAWRWVKIDLSRPDELEWWSVKAWFSGSHVAHGDRGSFADTAGQVLTTIGNQ
ncbi:hypothetical protein QBC40DRAFT_327419 [Triangularia verruculosa]|uniref:Uncharacterized protein n=1 Tax=Triangularia verruculosa TaxID=2587418 RepID=A0AAN6XQU3_9PEZI|nr:hypothetical protein QBC40DRAFT_327419 [Triangularia verruculosa]